MSYGIAVTIGLPFDEAVARTRQALAEQGFGVVSEINVQQILKSKIDVDIPPHIILGACAPGLAHRALVAEPSVGLLLPCNVVVRSTGDGTVVEMIDTEMMVELTANPQMRSIADEVGQRLKAALESVSNGA